MNVTIERLLNDDTADRLRSGRARSNCILSNRSMSSIAQVAKYRLLKSPTRMILVHGRFEPLVIVPLSTGGDHDGVSPLCRQAMLHR